MSKACQALSLLLVTSICLIWLVFALHGYPLLTGDTVCFLPAALELKNGHGLVNHLYQPLSLAENRFLFYPPVFPWVMSLLIPSTSEVSIYLGLYLVQVSSFLIALAVLLKLYKRFRSPSSLGPVWETAFVLLTILATSACFSAGYSRPEGLCKLFLITGIYVALTQSRYKLFLIGGLVIASLLTSPIFGLYMAMLSALYIIVSKQFTIGKIAVVAASMATGLLLAYLLYPYKGEELLHGMALHSQNVVFDEKASSLNLQNFVSQHVASLDIPLGIFLFLSAVAIGFYLIVKETNLSIRDRFLALSIFFMLVVTINYFSLKTIFMSYYMYVLTPLMIVLVTYATLRNRKLLLVSSVLFVAICAPFFRQLLIFVNNGTYGANYSIQQVRLHLLAKYPSLYQSEVGYTPSFWPLFINNTRANTVRFHNSPIDTKNGKYSYLIIQQVNSNLTSPPVISGYRLVENNFSKEPITLFGKRIANQPLAYQYAFYERI